MMQNPCRQLSSVSGARVKQPAQATLDKTIAIVAASRSETTTQKLQATQATSDNMLGLSRSAEQGNNI